MRRTLHLPQTLRDLLFDVERRLAARHPAGVARLDELANLGRQLGVGGGCGERAELGLDVDRRLAAGGAGRSSPSASPSRPIRSYERPRSASATSAPTSPSTDTPITTARKASRTPGTVTPVTSIAGRMIAHSSILPLTDSVSGRLLTDESI